MLLNTAEPQSVTSATASVSGSADLETVSESQFELEPEGSCTSESLLSPVDSSCLDFGSACLDSDSESDLETDSESQLELEPKGSSTSETINLLSPGWFIITKWAVTSITTKCEVGYC